MAFPVTVDLASSPEQPSYYGPFLSGGALYQVNYKTTGGDTPFGQLFMEKSLDGGVTWAEADPANGPIIATKEQAFLSAQDYVAACACQSTLDTTQIYVCWVDQSLQLNISPFTAGADTWGVAVPAVGQAGVIGCCAYRATDNSVVLAATGADVVTLQFLNHVISSFITFDVGGGTWGTWADLGFSDYPDATLWNQRPCGISIDADGTAHVYMQQITALSSTTPVQVEFGSSGTFNVPGDCVEIDIVRSYGGGAGGGSAVGAGNGGGGGGGFKLGGSIPVTPGDSLPVTVGLGGASDTDGGDSDFNGLVVAGGGKAGTSPAGGAAGTGDNAGGHGGAGGAGSGGGGGGAGGVTGPGGAGGPATGASSPGAGGTAGGGLAGVGGQGGQTAGGGPNGSPGAPVGGGGGGSNGGVGATGGPGQDGDVFLQYTPFTNSHPGRIWQQAISPGNALGTLTEIVEGEFPIGNGPVEFDVKAGSGIVAIAFSGVTATTNSNISVGKAAASVDVLVFSFQTINVGNSGSEIPPSPAIALDGTNIYCAYMSAPSTATVSYVYNLDSGAGFGSVVVIGAFANAGCRIQAAFLQGGLKLTFGTPTTGIQDYGIVESPEFLDFTNNVPGLDGNLITLELTAVEDGPDVVVVITPSGINQFLIQITFGYTVNGEGDRIPAGGTWAGLAALINATAAGAIINATGYSGFSPDADSLQPDGLQMMQGGSTGEATPSYFSGAPSPPPPISPIPISPGGPRVVPVSPNDFDACLAREYRLYNQIDRELLSCAKKPHCFLYDERQWGGNYDDAEEIGQGPPTGSIAFNPTGQVPLPAPVDGDVVIFSTRVPIGYDGVILGQFHGYYSVPIPGPITSVFVEGSGDIRWRVAVAKRFAKDCGDMTVTLGTLRTLSTVAGGIQVRSGDLIQYIVNVPNFSGGLAPGVGSILAGLHGWFFQRR